MSKRILVTGAGGYIGRHVVTALCDLGAEVLAVDFRPREFVLGHRAGSLIFLTTQGIFIRSWMHLTRVCTWPGETVLSISLTRICQTCLTTIRSFPG